MSRTASVPFFQNSIMKRDGPSFLVKAMEIPPVSRTIDFERLLARPRHKPNRLKFDQTNTECLNEKENDPLTMEDHFKLMDMPWIQKLRFQDPSEQMRLSMPKRPQETTVPDKAPHFFENDMQKWHQKFEKSIKDRTSQKKFLQTTHEFNLTTKNSNFQKSAYSLPKRRNSRQSAEAFTTIDFECIGNTNEFNHLINKKIGCVAPNPIQLDFEMNLRNYKSQTQFKGHEPWIYPKTKAIKAVVTDKRVFPMLPRLFKKQKNQVEENEDGTIKNQNDNHDQSDREPRKKAVIPPYSDIFRERNMQKVRHLFEKSNVISTMQWSSDLRHWHPDRIAKKLEEEGKDNILGSLAGKRRNQ
eukprot:403346422